MLLKHKMSLNIKITSPFHSEKHLSTTNYWKIICSFKSASDLKCGADGAKILFVNNLIQRKIIFFSLNTIKPASSILLYNDLSENKISRYNFKRRRMMALRGYTVTGLLIMTLSMRLLPSLAQHRDVCSVVHDHDDVTLLYPSHVDRNTLLLGALIPVHDHKTETCGAPANREEVHICDKIQVLWHTCL